MGQIIAIEDIANQIYFIRSVKVMLDRDLAELSLEELRGFSTLIDDDIFQVLTLEGSVASRDHIGGTAPRQVRAAIERARGRLG